MTYAVFVEATLTAEKRAELARRLSDNADMLEKRAQLNTAVNAARARTARANSHMDEFGVAELTEPDLEQLNRLFAAHAEPLQEYLRNVDSFRSARTAVREMLTTANTFLGGCTAQLDNPQNAPNVVAQAAQTKEAVQRITAERSVTVVRSWRRYRPEILLPKTLAAGAR